METAQLKIPASLRTQAAVALDAPAIMIKAGWPPDAWQAAVLRARPRRLLLNCSRQAGKSTVIACAAIDEALCHAPSLTLILSPSQRQSGEIFRTVKGVLGSLDLPMSPDAESLMRVELPNGSRIIALPGKEQNLRGYAKVSLLIIDEASRVPDDLYLSVRPMLAVSGGRLAALSTPFGKRGWWHKAWTEGVGWDRVKITAHDCPRISAAFLEDERRSLPDQWFRQEYLCEFAETNDAVFSFDDVQRALSSDVSPLFSVEYRTDSTVKALLLG